MGFRLALVILWLVSVTVRADLVVLGLVYLAVWAF